MAEIYLKDGVYYKDKEYGNKFSDQEMAALLWQLKGSLKRTSDPRSPAAKALTVGFLVLLLLFALAMVGVSIIQWWPDLVQRSQRPPAAISSPVNSTDAQLVMSEQIKNYSDRVADLEKLISVLLGLSAIYTIALGFSSYTSVQMNLQQVEKGIKSIEELRDRAEESTENLETLVTSYRDELAKIRDEIDLTQNYARVIPNVMATLALALQRPEYRSNAESATQDLRDLRSKYRTDVKVSFFLARAYKILEHFHKAVNAMTFFIEEKKAANQGRDDSVADAYYNRACYRSLLWQRAKDANDADQMTALQNSLVADVKECCSRDAKLLDDIPTDADFVPVLQEKWFKDALAKIRLAGS